MHEIRMKKSKEIKKPVIDPSNEYAFDFIGFKWVRYHVTKGSPKGLEERISDSIMNGDIQTLEKIQSLHGDCLIQEEVSSVFSSSEDMLTEQDLELSSVDIMNDNGNSVLWTNNKNRECLVHSGGISDKRSRATPSTSAQLVLIKSFDSPGISLAITKLELLPETGEYLVYYNGGEDCAEVNGRDIELAIAST